jgi:predicted dehydrogenase
LSPAHFGFYSENRQDSLSSQVCVVDKKIIQKNMRKIKRRIGKRVVIIGGGGDKNFFGRQHRNAGGLLWGQEVVGLLGSHNPQMSLAQAEAWGVRGFRDIGELVAAKSEFDYAINATPQDQREELAVACIEAGIPTYLEKPITHRLESGIRIMQAEIEHKVPVGVSLTWEYGYGATISNFIGSDPRVGDPVSGSAHYLQGWAGFTPGSRGFRGNPEKSGYWGSGGDLGLTHGLQGVVNTAGGRRIKKIIAAGNNFGIKGENERDAHFIMFFENGAMVSLQSSQVYGERGNDEEIEMAFSTGVRIQRKNTDLDHALVTIPGYGTEMVITREGGDWSKVPIVRDAISKARYLFPHTSGHGRDQFKGHYGRELPPGHHEWGCPEAIATGLFRFGNWVSAWKHGSKKDAKSFGVVSLGDGLHQMEVMDAAEKSDRNNHALTEVVDCLKK